MKKFALLLGCLLPAATGVAPAETPKAVSLAEYAAHKQGEDWAPALAKAFEDSLTVSVPAGRYPCSPVKFSNGMTLQGSGPGTVFIPLGMRLFDIAGKEGKEIPITADITDFSNAIQLESSGGLAPGDNILIRGQRNSMLREGTEGVNHTTAWVLGRTRRSSCFFGEMDVVQAIAGTRILTADKRLFPDYFKDDSREAPPPGEGFIRRKSTTVSKLSMVENVTLRNFAVEGTAGCPMPFRIRYAKGCLLDDVTFTTSVESFKKDGTPDLSVVYAIYVWNTTIRNFKVTLAPELLAILSRKKKAYENFSNYNLFKIISSTGSGLENCEANGGTHAFNITRSASVDAGGGIPSIDCFVRNCVASNCIWAGIKIQQGCYNTEVTGNTVTASDQGIITCARNTRITDNKLITTAPHATDAYYTHIRRGGTMGIGVIEGYACGSLIRNNTIEGFRSGLALVDGYEDKNRFEEGDIVFEDNTVSRCLRGFTLYKNPSCESLGRNLLNITLRNNTFTCSPDKDSEPTAGIHLHKQTAGIEIAGNTFRHFEHGVWMDGIVDRIGITGNRFEKCGTGITLREIHARPGEGEVHIKESGNTFSGTSRQTHGLDQSPVKRL